MCIYNSTSDIQSTCNRVARRLFLIMICCPSFAIMPFPMKVMTTELVEERKRGEEEKNHPHQMCRMMMMMQLSPATELQLEKSQLCTCNQKTIATRLVDGATVSNQLLAVATAAVFQFGPNE